MRLYWQIFFKPEGEGGAGGGAGGDAGGAGGAGGGAAGGAGGVVGGGNSEQQQQQQQLSLRAQLAASLDGDDRKGFEDWTNKYATDKDWVKATHNMRSTYDQRATIPGADAPKEERHKFFTKLGKPETPTDYKFDWGEAKPDNPTTARFEAFKQFAHEHDLTQGQFEKLVSLNNQFSQQDTEAAMAQLEEAQGKTAGLLREEWGPDFEANLEYAKAAGADFADTPEEWKALMDMPIIGKEGTMRVGDHPVMLKVLAKIGRAYSEDARVRVMERTGETQSLQAKIAEIEEEAAKANRKTSEAYYHNRLAPLYAKLYPGKTRATGVR